MNHPEPLEDVLDRALRRRLLEQEWCGAASCLGIAAYGVLRRYGLPDWLL
jgi:hypothetical protein